MFRHKRLFTPQREKSSCSCEMVTDNCIWLRQDVWLSHWFLCISKAAGSRPPFENNNKLNCFNAFFVLLVLLWVAGLFD